MGYVLGVIDPHARDASAPACFSGLRICPLVGEHRAAKDSKPRLMRMHHPHTAPLHWHGFHCMRVQDYLAAGSQLTDVMTIWDVSRGISSELVDNPQGRRRFQSARPLSLLLWSKSPWPCPSFGPALRPSPAYMWCFGRNLGLIRAPYVLYGLSI